MKMQTLMLTAIAALSTAAVAAGPAPGSRPLGLSEMVAHMESTYRGEVTAIELDTSGDKRAHYHVDIGFSGGSPARLDVDAVTRRISVRQGGPLRRDLASLSEVATLVAGLLPGQLLAAQLDDGDGAAPHYDVDVRVTEGKIGRLKVDAATRAIDWRQPAIMDE